MISVFTFGQTSGVEGDGARLRQNLNMRAAIFRPSRFDLRDPEDSQRAGRVSNAHDQRTPLQAEHRGVSIAFGRQEDSGQAQIWATATLWPHQTLL